MSQQPASSLSQSPRSSPPPGYARIPQLDQTVLGKLSKLRTRKSRKRTTAYLRELIRDGDANSDDEDELDAAEGGPKDYISSGRCFCRVGDPFTKIYAIVQHGLQVESRDTDDEGEDDTIVDKRLQEDWKILCATIPGFKAEMVGLAEKRFLRRRVCLDINEGVNRARSDDSNGLKMLILTYLHLDVTVPLNPPIHPANRDKTCRGWSHPTTALLMTPIELPANPTTWAEIKTGRRKITAHQLPRFLYPTDHVYDADDLDKGLFQGHLMFRCAKRVFMGPSAALAAPGFKKGRAGIGKLVGLHKMTPRAIAYIAVQVRFALSDAPEWSVVDRDFNYETFFWNIVEMLDGDEGKQVLAAFDSEVFGVVEDEGPELPDGSQAQSTLGRLKAQRAAKRQRVV